MAKDEGRDPTEEGRGPGADGAPEAAAAAGGARPDRGQAGPGVVIVTGMSGAGRTEALHALEDLGYYCIDNLPPTMLVPLAELVGQPAGTGRRLAVVCDMRSLEFLTQFKAELAKLAAHEVDYRVLFLDADDETLLKRYSSLRRRHPLARGSVTVAQAIARERAHLVSIRELANVVIDTSDMRASGLRRRIAREFSALTPQEGMNVSVSSFGFKYGLPLDADLVMDVRFLANPYYDPAMRELTGFDEPVRAFVMDAPETARFMTAWERLLDAVMPGYVSEGKQHLSIAIGCTGGQHRSVAIAEATAGYLREAGYRVTTMHRDVSRARQAAHGEGAGADGGSR